MQQPQEQNFEQNLSRLEQIIEELEEGELPLEESIVRYEEGMEKLKKCYEILGKMEEKVILLSKQQDEFHETPFEKHDRT